MKFFIFTCPVCGQRFRAAEESCGDTAYCSNCQSQITIQKQDKLYPLQSNNDTLLLVTGIVSLVIFWIPLISLPLPIAGFILSCNKKFTPGIILNAFGMVLSFVFSVYCFFCM